jgi:hypothetical protein
MSIDGFEQRTTLYLSASLMLAGQLLYVVVTLLHAGGEANNHPAIFANYASSDIWTVVHLGQFVCTALLLAGLFALFFALGGQGRAAKWAGLFGAVSAVVALAWTIAPEAEKGARFASAEAMRWLEWGMRSYQNFVLGLAVLLFAGAVAGTAWAPKAIAYLMGLAGLIYLGQAWTAGSEGFSQTHTIAIVATEVVNVAWMAWLLVVAWRMQGSPPASAAS